MNNAFPRLLKILSLERQLGYRNKAVIGGLDKFASRWEADARAEAPDAPQVGEIISLLIGYPVVEDTAARERIIEEILRRVREIAPSLTATEQRATPPPQSRPAATASAAPRPDAGGPRTAARARSRSPAGGAAAGGGRTDRSGVPPRPSQRAYSAGNQQTGAKPRPRHQNRRRLSRRRPLPRQLVQRSLRKARQLNPRRQKPLATPAPPASTSPLPRGRRRHLTRQASCLRHLPDRARPRSASARL